MKSVKKKKLTNQFFYIRFIRDFRHSSSQEQLNLQISPEESELQRQFGAKIELTMKISFSKGENQPEN